MTYAFGSLMVMCPLLVLYSSSNIQDISTQGANTDKEFALVKRFKVQHGDQSGLSPKLYGCYLTGPLEIIFFEKQVAGSCNLRLQNIKLSQTDFRSKINI